MGDVHALDQNLQLLGKSSFTDFIFSIFVSQFPLPLNVLCLWQKKFYLLFQ